jgi:GNAT superfamily N-acetyltransferase
MTDSIKRTPAGGPHPSPGAASAFAQGADLYLETASAAAALWWTQTPPLAGERIGCIGAFLAEGREAAREVLDAALAELRRRGCTLALGPMNGNTWRRHRLVTWSDGRPPFFLEPQNPVEYIEDFVNAGFAPLAQYSSSVVDLAQAERPDFSEITRRIEDAGLRIRPLNPQLLEADLRAIHALSLEAFAGNFLYTPLAETEFLSMYLPIVRQLDPRWLLLAERGGELAGFVFTLPDPLAIQQGTTPALIVKTLAVHPERRCAGLGSVLLDQAQEAARESGLCEAIHALQHEKNASLRVGGRFHPQVFRRYTLFAQRLADPASSP